MKSFLVTAQAYIDAPDSFFIEGDFEDKGWMLVAKNGVALVPIIALEDELGNVYSTDLQFKKFGLQVVAYTEDTGVTTQEEFDF